MINVKKNISCFFFATILLGCSESNINCPIENATLTPSFIYLNRNEKISPGISLTGEKGKNVYSVSNGVVKKINWKRMHIFIGDNNITYDYKYLNINENLKEGHRIKNGDVIGSLNWDFLHIDVKKEGKSVSVYDYIECF